MERILSPLQSRINGAFRESAPLAKLLGYGVSRRRPRWGSCEIMGQNQRYADKQTVCLPDDELFGRGFGLSRSLWYPGSCQGELEGVVTSPVTVGH
jgi:hypothetical protein